MSSLHKAKGRLSDNKSSHKDTQGVIRKINKMSNSFLVYTW